MKFQEIYEMIRTAPSLEALKKTLVGIHIDAIENTVPFFTPAAKLAFEGHITAVEWLRQLGADVNDIAMGFAYARNHQMVDRYKKEFEANPRSIVMGYALAGEHQLVEKLQEVHNIDMKVIARSYALAKNDTQVESYRKRGASIYEIAIGYAAVNCHDKVDLYRLTHGADVHDIVMAYAAIGNDDKVAEYINTHKASVDRAAQGYAMAGNFAKVEYYRTIHRASVNNIAAGFAYVRNHSMVEKYRIEYKADECAIAEGFAASKTRIPAFYKTVLFLKDQGDIGRALINTLSRLKTGQQSAWSPYWKGAGLKLDRIIQAIEQLPENSNLSLHCEDPQSALYQALNIQRLGPISFFSQATSIRAKSLDSVSETMLNIIRPSS